MFDVIDGLSLKRGHARESREALSHPAIGLHLLSVTRLYYLRRHADTITIPSDTYATLHYKTLQPSGPTLRPLPPPPIFLRLTDRFSGTSCIQPTSLATCKSSLGLVRCWV